ncbi:MAG: hypothetical protein JWP10_1682 [Nocardioidaceae bacterium]|nr:hypothetical protein [Nocardioidaceae bacterium]
MKLYKIVLCAAAASLLLVGCGGKDESASPSKSVGTTLTQANFVSKLSAAQQDAKTSHVSMAIGVAGQQIKAEGDLAVSDKPEETAMSLTMDIGEAGMGPGTYEIRLVDEIMYLNLGAMTGDKFTKVDLKDATNPIAKQYQGTVDQLDPSKTLASFGDAVKSFTKAGEPIKLDGVDAQPYDVVVDTAKLKDAAAGGAAAQVPAQLTFTFFVGPDNLPRRMTSEVSGAKIQVDYSKWGEPVSVKAPAASEIAESSLLDKLPGAAA